MNYSQPSIGFYAAAMKANLGITNTFLRGMQRLRQSQLEQIRASSDECAQWLKQADAVHDYTALHSLQSDMISQYVERVSSYWNKLAHATTQLQTELSAALQECGGTATQDLRHEVEQMQTELSQGAASLFKPVLGSNAFFAFGAGDKAAPDDDEPEPSDHNGSAMVRRSSSAKRTQR